MQADRRTYTLTLIGIFCIPPGGKVTVTVLQSSCCCFNQDCESSAMCCVKNEAEVDETQSHVWPVVLETLTLPEYVSPP